MAADAAAQRSGVRLGIADLDANSPFGQLEASLPGRGRFVQKQADDLTSALNATKDVPSKSGLSTESRVLPGENLRQGYDDAAQETYDAARNKFQAVDDYASANKLRPPIPQQTYQALKSAANLTDDRGNQLVFDLIKDYKPQEAGWMQAIAGSPQQWVLKGAPITTMSDMRVAVNMALRKLDPAMSRDPTQANIRFLREKLLDIKSAIDGDLENWGTINSKNQPAVDLLNNANQFYRDVVVPDVINNKVVRKATKGPIGSNPRGYQTANQFYSDVVNNPELTDRIAPSMGSQQQDLLSTLRTANDARKTMLTGEVPAQSGMNRMVGALGTALGHPMTAVEVALSHIPGLGDAASTQLAKRLYFSRNVLGGPDVRGGLGTFQDLSQAPLAGRAAWGAGQYPRTELDDWANGKIGQRP
jgi:hypothetical protein